MSDLSQPESPPLTVREIQAAACRYFGITRTQLLARTHQRTVARRRQIAMYVARRQYGKSLLKIGRAFGVDHTTVLHGDRRIHTEIEGGNHMLAHHVAGVLRAIEDGRGQLAPISRGQRS